MKTYLFSTRGITDRFFCGNIYVDKMPTDRINYHGTLMTFQECEDEGFCKSFDTLKEARAFSTTEELNLEDFHEEFWNVLEEDV